MIEYNNPQDLKRLIRKLNKIGITISREKNVDTILEMILNESIDITNSDGGTLYIVKEFEGQKYLVITLSKNYSVDFNYIGYKIPIDNQSIVGYVAQNGIPVTINNIQNIQNSHLQQFKLFDQALHYKTLNLMAIPMIDYQGNVIGVLQIINKKKDNSIKLTEDNIYQNIVDFTKEDEEIILSLASQASLLIERIHLYQRIEKNIANTRYALISLFNSMKQVIANLSEDILIEQEEFKKYASLDDLTGLFTRNEGMIYLEKQIQLSKMNETHFVVCFIDVDGLKQVNDTFGHQIGDELLKSFAQILKESIRSYDIAFRYGGDEFVLILYKATIREANIVLTRIQNKIDEFNAKVQKPYKIQISYGFAEYSPTSNLNSEDLIKIADENMYKVKKEKKKSRPSY
ncbi:diguanylate cyclase with GAF sensor [Caldicellulosiruptor kronotskyensis 2002]|uniref:Diguanylate cyclase with GAF sensor n=1 Tax=Caldicellulosiruptor kronotskyensis (strain DSM 18902 / VKM B-2412 / 2002) TaxID=632348 RepID=E4SDD5_CALK2|nr:sensor domain-containing diguanylate cyclase [Caldicellulosiruptor kronotskyensis]ADQ45744.1 diguanylate cyclase with GAF sensor [Caldicellulosiruptor kronotskyensis 2002]